MKTVALWIIAVCYLANTISVYDYEDGSTDIYFGSFGWHFEDGSK